MSSQPVPPTQPDQDRPQLTRSQAAVGAVALGIAESSDTSTAVIERTAGKAPRSLAEPCSLTPDSSEEVQVPDLAEYFMEFPEVSYEQQIKICRAYASFLVAQMPPRPRRKRVKSK